MPEAVSAIGPDPLYVTTASVCSLLPRFPLVRFFARCSHQYKYDMNPDISNIMAGSAVRTLTLYRMGQDTVDPARQLADSEEDANPGCRGIKHG